MRLEHFKRKEIIIFSSLFLLFFSVAFRFVLSSRSSSFEKPLEIASTSSKEKEDEEVVKEPKMYVDIKGAVKLPGMYEVTSDMRILNVIDLAGGLDSEADDKQVNFSARVEDQMVIYIPKEGEDISTIELSQGTQQKSSGTNGINSEGKINLNLASKEELMSLNGVGEKKAEKIIAYREENGSFKTIEDLKNVNGFGEKSFESLKEWITI